MRRVLFLLVAVAMATAACGSETPPETTGAAATAVSPGSLPEGAFAIRASSDLGVGTERLLIALAGPANQRLGSPDLGVTFEVFPEDRPDAVQRLTGIWIWAIPDVSGLYRATVEFDEPGIWLARVIPEGSGPLELIGLQVSADPLTPALGEAAPQSTSATAADAPLAEITSDPDPDPRLYEMSIADAVTSGRPSVIVFATPRFCQTAICGPTLDDVKALMPAHPQVNWLHVEVFTNLDDPANLALVPAVEEWGLPSEPWVFVVDAAGVVQGRFEGVIDDVELAGLLDRLV